MKAEIIGVGTELILGNIVNTNAQFLSCEMAQLGIDVFYHTAVGDNYDRLKKIIELALSRSDLLIFTGGLGPTEDDMTKETVSSVLDVDLILDDNILEKIKYYFSMSHKKMTKNNEKQAYIFKDSIPLKNEIGTAPGILLNYKNKKIILLPGPPQEMKLMFKKYVIPLIKQECIIKSKTIKTIGIGESNLETLIKDLIEKQTNPTIATYAKQGQVDIRVTAKAKNEEQADIFLKNIIEKINFKIKNYIYSYEDKSIEQVLFEILKKKNFKIAFCESCTGGLISSRFTKIPGASQVFDRGIVTYTNQSKMEELDVKKQTLEKYGAVSSNTAIEMAKGLLSKSKVDIALSTTGIAGPSGGTNEKPVGLVYIGLCTKNDCNVFKCNFSGSREAIQNKTATKVFNEARKYLLFN